LDKHSVAIHIDRIKETPSHGDTIVHKQIAKELGSEHGRVRFLLAHQRTVVYLGAADNGSGPIPSCLHHVNQPVMTAQTEFTSLSENLLDYS
jgi:hypothetical protein